jgi:single-stranded DNA-binding protein
MATRIMGIGDLAEGRGFTRHTDRNGMQCKVIGDLEMREWQHEDGSEGKGAAYRVKWTDGVVSVQEPESLTLVLTNRAQGPAWGFTGLNPLARAA